ncbi:MAG TPA: FAD-dependent oxidoreductase [Xanthobacteraceae bacterium]|nr:FAD-dependent oxidoreductase [Xanthobacteraceae bacterium]
MTQTSAPNKSEGPASAGPSERRRLTIDRDVDVCIVGGGLAGLTIALEVARKGASVAVLEARQIGWNASGHQLGSVLPGFGAAIETVISRVGIDAAREIWGLSVGGMALVRHIAAVSKDPRLRRVDGALEVSHVDHGDELVRRLEILGELFGADVEGWQADQVRDVLRTRRYFHAMHFPSAFQVDDRAYLEHLTELARLAGARIYEDTPVVGIDYAGIRKRIATPLARMRADHLVLAGNVHLGAPFPRLAATLTPVWRYGALTAPLGEKMQEAIRFGGSVTDTAKIDHYRVVDGDRLLWASPETTWAMEPKKFARAIAERIRKTYPALGPVTIEETFGGATGETVHGMPQVGEFRRGLWIASGFGRQGMATSAMAALLVSRGILHGDDRWKLLSPFELVWAGGMAGRAAAQFANLWMRGQARTLGAVARSRENARERKAHREARRAAASGR